MRVLVALCLALAAGAPRRALGAGRGFRASAEPGSGLTLLGARAGSVAAARSRVGQEQRVEDLEDDSGARFSSAALSDEGLPEGPASLLTSLTFTAGPVSLHGFSLEGGAGHRGLDHRNVDLPR